MAAFQSDVPLQALDRALDMRRMVDVGRRANREVLHLIREENEHRNVHCFRVDQVYVPLRPETTIRLAADFGFSEAGKTSVFWLQPRRNHGLDSPQFSMFGSLLRLGLARTQFAKAEMEILDLSVPRGSSQRSINRILLSDLPPIADEEVTEALQKVLNAYDEIAAMDLNWAEIRNRPKPASHPEGDQSNMFGDEL